MRLTRQQQIIRPKVIRQSGDISETTAVEIQDLVRRLAETDVMTGKSPSCGEWQLRPKNRYKVASYPKFTVDQRASAIRRIKRG